MNITDREHPETHSQKLVDPALRQLINQSPRRVNALWFFVYFTFAKILFLESDSIRFHGPRGVGPAELNPKNSFLEFKFYLDSYVDHILQKI